MAKKVAIIGAGITGLYCAYLLEQQGFFVEVYDKNSTLGGRMCTQRIDGFLIDHGFHVMQTGYPLASSVFDYDKLGCKPFGYGTDVIAPSEKKIKHWRLLDPFRHPIKSIFYGLKLFTSPMNLLKVGLLRVKLSRISDAEIFTNSNITTNQFLLEYGFSQSFIDRFFLPLFGGIFLENQLRTNESMFKFVFKNMSRGSMVLPKDGIIAAPKSIADKLQTTEIHLGSEVNILDNQSLMIKGEKKNFDHIIKSFDSMDKSTNRHVWTVYFSSIIPPSNSKYIMLNSKIKDEQKIISHVAIPTNIQPSYSADNRSLIVATIIGEDSDKLGLIDKNQIISHARSELITWFGKGVADWKLITALNTKKALPENTPADNFDLDLSDLQCGDYKTHGSVEGCLVSAKILVEKLITL
tara:strand:- start:513 stop:1739 length:1227 start_codon:yes stop_codon:yes gene_type:complete